MTFGHLFNFLLLGNILNRYLENNQHQISKCHGRPLNCWFGIGGESFFTNFSNLSSLLDIFVDTATKSTNAQDQPFYYYFMILFPIELGLLVLFFVGIYKYKKNLFCKFLVFWSIFSILIFSIISYKTKWMLTAVVFPWVLLADVQPIKRLNYSNAHLFYLSS